MNFEFDIFDKIWNFVKEDIVKQMFLVLTISRRQTPFFTWKDL